MTHVTPAMRAELDQRITSAMDLIGGMVDDAGLIRLVRDGGHAAAIPQLLAIHRDTPPQVLACLWTCALVALVEARHVDHDLPDL